MNYFHATILTIFPEMFPSLLQYSLAGKALKNNIWSYDTINIRDFGISKHRNIDDKPYGGGSGLIMRPDVLGDTLDYALTKSPQSKIYYPSPRGIIFNQAIARKIANEKRIIILCGRFEGIDERIIDEYNATEISIGDYILSGGEVATNVILDAIIRLLPGVLVNQKTLEEESFELSNNASRLLEYPLYTKPAIWRNRSVPEILLSGDHNRIKKWKHDQSLSITKELRSDLIK